VRGRWFHTAVITAILNGAVALSALIVALIILVTITSIPLWFFSMIATLVYALTVPFAAIALTLLYGDAIAEHAGVPADGADGIEGAVAPA
jgi:hypothetical protein